MEAPFAYPQATYFGNICDTNTEIEQSANIFIQDDTANEWLEALPWQKEYIYLFLSRNPQSAQPFYFQQGKYTFSIQNINGQLYLTNLNTNKTRRIYICSCCLPFHTGATARQKLPQWQMSQVPSLWSQPTMQQWPATQPILPAQFAMPPTQPDCDENVVNLYTNLSKIIQLQVESLSPVFIQKLENLWENVLQLPDVDLRGKNGAIVSFEKDSNQTVFGMADIYRDYYAYQLSTIVYDTYKQNCQDILDVLTVKKTNPLSQDIINKNMPGSGRIRNAASLCLSSDKQSILLVQAMTDKRWMLPGGQIDKGETSFFAARREWQEEVGTPFPTNIEIVNEGVWTYHNHTDIFVFTLNPGVTIVYKPDQVVNKETVAMKMFPIQQLLQKQVPLKQYAYNSLQWLHQLGVV